MSIGKRNGSSLVVGYACLGASAILVLAAWNSRQHALDRALQCACMKRNISRIQSLLESGADPSASISLTTHRGLLESVAQTLGFLHWRRSAVQYSSPWTELTSAQPGRSSTMCYVPNSDPRLIGLLVKHGAKCNETDDLGKTALDRAIEWGLYRTCDALLENGANPNHTFNSDLPGTPLTSAVWRRKDRIAEILLAHGANPNQCNSSRHYPLHYAVAQSDGKIVRLLLSAGADVGVRDSKGVTPIMLAREIGDLETLALLKGRQ